MTVLNDIRAGLAAILENSAGSVRTIPAGRFKRYETAKDFLANATVTTPRPFYMAVGPDVPVSDLPSDLAGTYRYFGKTITIVVSYAVTPHDAMTLEDTIDTDRHALVRALEWPLNWATVAGWVGTSVDTERDQELDDRGNATLELLILTLTISYREDFST